MGMCKLHSVPYKAITKVWVRAVEGVVISPMPWVSFHPIPLLCFYEIGYPTLTLNLICSRGGP